MPSALAHLPFSDFLFTESEKAKIGAIVEFNNFAEDGNFPVIDFTSEDLGEQLDDAAKTFGFFQLVNHGVELDTIREMQRRSKELFDLPADRKLVIKCTDKSKIGYGVGRGFEFNGGTRFWLEAFEAFDSSAQITEFSNKLWPDSPETAQKFRETVEKYTAAMRKLGEELTKHLDNALGIKPGAMFERCSREYMHIRVNYYPTCPDPSRTLGKAPHYDKHFITLLHQDEVGGLQVLKDGKWLGLKPKPDAIIVNIGKALEMYSNGAYVGMKHRVVNNSSAERMSIVYLICPRPDSKLDTPPEIIDDNRTRKYRSVTYEEMLDEIDRVRHEDFSKSYLSTFEVCTNF